MYRQRLRTTIGHRDTIRRSLRAELNIVYPNGILMPAFFFAQWL